MILAITRFVLVAAGLLGGYVVTQVVDWQTELGLERSYVIFLFVILGAAIGYVLGGIAGREFQTAWQRIEARVSELAGVDVVLGTIGLLVGLAVAFFASQPLRLLQPVSLSIIVSILLFLVCANIGMTVSLTRRREFIQMFPRFAPAEMAETRHRLLVLDTSAIIDGRFAEMRQLGFIPGSVKVPRFVLGELHTLADSSDEGRRARGRRGLDYLTALPEERTPEVMEVDYSDVAAVDEKLMRLASDAKAVIVTVDFSLAKVARVRGIEVLNLNEAAAALKPNFLPGDPIHLHVAKPGKESDQGVGYLEDGTMVVIAGGRDLVGKDAEVEVTSVLQTSGGRMIFASLRPERVALMQEEATA